MPHHIQFLVYFDPIKNTIKLSLKHMTKTGYITKI